MRKALALLTAAVALLLGCGDSGSDEDQITTAIESYAEAISDDDGEAFCGTLTEELRNAIGPDTEDCDRAVAAARATQGDSFDPEVEDIVVKGGSATARMRSGGDTWDVKLERGDDQWLIGVFARFPNGPESPGSAGTSEDSSG
jgi:hypothetical protein